MGGGSADKLTRRWWQPKIKKKLTAVVWFFGSAHLYRHPDWPIIKYDVRKPRFSCFLEKIFMQRTSLPSISCRQFECGYWKMLCLRRATTTVSIILGTTAPHHCPHPATPPSTSVAFFVTHQFSNLVPYVVILKTLTSKVHEHICLSAAGVELGGSKDWQVWSIIL